MNRQFSGPTVIDAHTHLGLESFIVKKIPEWKLKKPAFQVKMENTPGDLISSMDKYGISRSVTYPFPLEEVDSVPANTYVLDKCREHSDRLIPFSLLDDEPQRWIEQGSRGFKQHFLLAPERFNAADVYKTIADSGLPLIAHFTTGRAVEEARTILEAAPGIKLIVAHMGRQVPDTGEGVLELVKALKDESRVFFETSTVDDTDVMKRAADIVGTGRIIFGSDNPFSSTGHELGLISRGFEDKDDRDKLLSGNILRLLNYSINPADHK